MAESGAVTLLAAADGSALGNPGPAGWGWYIDDARWACGGWPRGTNNQGELVAVLDLLRRTRGLAEPLEILCDSQYVINSVTKWMHGWKRKGWKKADGKPVLNVEIMRALDAELAAAKADGREVTFRWVKGHAGHELNEKADRLANGAAQAYARGSTPEAGPGIPGASAGAGAGPRPEDAAEDTAESSSSTPSPSPSRPSSPARDDGEVRDLFAHADAAGGDGAGAPAGRATPNTAATAAASAVDEVREAHAELGRLVAAGDGAAVRRLLHVSWRLVDGGRTTSRKVFTGALPGAAGAPGISDAWEAGKDTVVVLAEGGGLAVWQRAAGRWQQLVLRLG